jgi:hypothetical protein
VRLKVIQQLRSARIQASFSSALFHRMRISGFSIAHHTISQAAYRESDFTAAVACFRA